MIDKGFWNDVLRDGAILGCLMALSRFFESYVLILSDMSLQALSLISSLEMLLAAVVFIWLVYRFARRRSLSADPSVGYSYGSGVIHIFVVSLLTGVVVGLANALFMAIIGYEAFVESYVDRIMQLSQIVPGSEELFATLIEQVESSPAPSVFDSLLNSMNSYIITGGITAFIVASKVRREPKIENRE
ncbi:MAG: DUF4199 domain-containing protein [Alistipes sp.]|nr:DUF4199 domain-containing protein [Alistipes sp.]